LIGSRGFYTLVPLTQADLARCQELIAQNRDIDPGLADVAVVATAEWMGVQRILTVDERDLRAIRPKKGMTFVLLPGDVEP
jgi:predicted nucleic acid-binding protein